MSLAGSTSSESVRVAKGALEGVCSGQCLANMDQFYSPDFVDHVNGATLHGFNGISKSVEGYRRVFSNLTIEVVDHVAEGDRVACRFIVRGTALGRAVQFDGITISRLKDGRIAEDWSVTDTTSLMRQLGAIRLMLVLGKMFLKRGS